MPNIAVSFDQQRAVRIGDGARLVAESPWRNVCQGCEAAMLDRGSCAALNAPAQCCSRHIRKDHRDIVWRLAE